VGRLRRHREDDVLRVTGYDDLYKRQLLGVVRTRRATAFPSASTRRSSKFTVRVRRTGFLGWGFPGDSVELYDLVYDATTHTVVSGSRGRGPGSTCCSPGRAGRVSRARGGHRRRRAWTRGCGGSASRARRRSCTTCPPFNCSAAGCPAGPRSPPTGSSISRATACGSKRYGPRAVTSSTTRRRGTRKASRTSGTDCTAYSDEIRAVVHRRAARSLPKEPSETGCHRPRWCFFRSACDASWVGGERERERENGECAAAFTQGG